MRTINVWRKQLSVELFETIAIEPASGVADASVWRKHKKTGVITQFARGKSMQDYRASLLKNSEQNMPLTRMDIDVIATKGIA